MAKIIKIEGDTVSIGTNDGGIRVVRNSELNFIPYVGDEVDLFEDNGTVIVTENVNRTNNTYNIQQPVYVANNKKAVNKVAYCILAFLLGGIGVHKFYAGKVGSGILCILFCWTGIPALIAFIEFIIAICKDADANGNILV